MFDDRETPGRERAHRGRVPALSVSLTVCLFSLSALVTGCGDDGLGKRYRVSGTITYGGKPVEQGIITFEPVDPNGRVAAGSITAGEYSLTTLQPDDGALAGKYRVTILSKDVDAAMASDPMAKKAEDPQKQAHYANK